MSIKIIGAGLAGCEAAWQAANLGADVILCESETPKNAPPRTKAITLPSWYAATLCARTEF